MVRKNTLARNEFFMFEGTFVDLSVNLSTDWFVLHAPTNAGLTRRIIKLVRRINIDKTCLPNNTSAKEALEMLGPNMAQFEMETKKEMLQGSESFVAIIGHTRIGQSGRREFFRSSISIMETTEQGHQ